MVGPQTPPSLSEVPPGTHQEGEEEEPLAADAEVEDAEDVE